MIRNIMMSAAVAVVGFLGLAAPAASAKPPIGHGKVAHFGRFVVLVKHRGHWDREGVYRDRADAERAARRLRHKGLIVKVERA